MPFENTHHELFHIPSVRKEISCFNHDLGVEAVHGSCGELHVGSLEHLDNSQGIQMVGVQSRGVKEDTYLSTLPPNNHGFRDLGDPLDGLFYL